MGDHPMYRKLSPTTVVTNQSKPRSTTRSMKKTNRIRFLIVAICCVILAAAAMSPVTRLGLLRIVNASNPATSNITVPSTAGQTVTVTWTGSIPPLTNATSDCAALADTPAVDQHVSTVNVPNGLYNTTNAKFTFNISWSNPDND